MGGNHDIEEPNEHSLIELSFSSLNLKKKNSLARSSVPEDG